MKPAAGGHEWKPIYEAADRDRSTAPADEVARFLANQTIYCSAFSARIRPEQCGTNKASGLHPCLSCARGEDAPQPAKATRKPFTRVAATSGRKRPASPEKSPGYMDRDRWEALPPQEQAAVLLSVRAQLKKKRITHENVSVHVRLSRGSVNHTLYGRNYGIKVREGIAQLLGQPYETVWAPAATSPKRQKRQTSPKSKSRIMEAKC